MINILLVSEPILNSTFMDGPIIDLTHIITYPLVELIQLEVISLISISLILWILSSFFYFKKRDFKTAFYISMIVVTIPFIIRSINIILPINYKYGSLISISSLLIEPLLLLILIKKVYDLEWFKTIGIWFLTYSSKLTATSVIVLIMILFFTTIPQDYYQENLKWRSIETAQDIVDFKILEPTYIPRGYHLMSIKPDIPKNEKYSKEGVTLSYGMGGSVISLHQRLRQNPANFSNDFPKGGEPVIINNHQGLYYDEEDLYKEPYLLWYSEETMVQFSIFDSIGNELSKGELIKIAESIQSDQRYHKIFLE